MARLSRRSKPAVGLRPLKGDEGDLNLYIAGDISYIRIIQ